MALEIILINLGKEWRHKYCKHQKLNMFLVFAEPNKIETCLKLFCIVLGLHKVTT